MTTNSKPLVNITIRWLIRSDGPQVLAIEQSSFDHPWTDDDFLNVLRVRNCIGMVAEHGPMKIVGFMIYELNPDCLKLLNFAVHPQFTRRGIGTLMVERLIAKLWQQGRTRISAQVWERNLVAQQFFRAAGFKVVDTVPEEGSPVEDDDAYVFRFDLKEGE